MKKLLVIIISFGVLFSCSRETTENEAMKNKDKSKVSLLDVQAYIPSFSSTTSSIPSQQGKINNTDNKVKVKIPYTGGSGSYEEIKVYKDVQDKNGHTKRLILTIPSGSFNGNPEGVLEAEIKVEGEEEYLVPQLTIGWEKDIAEFVIRINSGVSKVLLKGIGGIPDRCYNKTTKECWGYGADEKEHEFIYLPISLSNGQTWLSQNLGAEYSRVGSNDFAPQKQDFSTQDEKAYGSLFQWQRPSDGHELMTWDSNTSGKLKHWYNDKLSNDKYWRPDHNKFIKHQDSWVVEKVNSNEYNKNLWQRNGYNNPCPEGFHVPTKAELETFYNTVTSNGTSINSIWDNTKLRLSASGKLNPNARPEETSKHGFYWSSEQSNSNNKASYNLDFNSSNSSPNLSNTPVFGFSVRCIKD